MNRFPEDKLRLERLEEREREYWINLRERIVSSHPLFDPLQLREYELKIRGVQEEDSPYLSLKYEIVLVPAPAWYKGNVFVEAVHFPETLFPTVTFPELHSFLQPYCERAMREGKFHILGIISSREWDKEAIKYVEKSKKGGFSHSFLKPLLIDVPRRKFYHNPQDQQTCIFQYLFTFETESQMLEKCLKYIKEEFLAKESLLKRDIIRSLRLPPYIVQKALSRLLDSGDYLLEKVGEVDEVLYRK